MYPIVSPIYAPQEGLGDPPQRPFQPDLPQFAPGTSEPGPNQRSKPVPPLAWRTQGSLGWKRELASSFFHHPWLSEAKDMESRPAPPVVPSAWTADIGEWSCSRSGQRRRAGATSLLSGSAVRSSGGSGPSRTTLNVQKGVLAGDPQVHKS